MFFVFLGPVGLTVMALFLLMSNPALAKTVLLFGGIFGLLGLAFALSCSLAP